MICLSDLLDVLWRLGLALVLSAVVGFDFLEKALERLWERRKKEKS